MRAAEIRRMSAAWQRGYWDGNDCRANAWMSGTEMNGDTVRQTAGANARANFDNPDSQLDYSLGFERACGVR